MSTGEGRVEGGEGRRVAPGWERWLLWLCGAVAGVCLILVLVTAWHWPLVGDAAIVHYLVFLMEHGMAPYRDIVDAQMPGTYLVDAAAMRVFGGDAIGLRLYDGALVLLAMAAMVWVAWPVSRVAGLVAGGVFGLLHARDGLVQVAERDLVMAVLLLWGYALAFAAVRKGRTWVLLPAGVLLGWAGTIKPTAVPAGLAVLVLAVVWGGPERARVKAAWWCLGGLVAPVVVVVVFLEREGSLRAFWEALRHVWPYYATLGRRPFWKLVGDSVSSPVRPLVILWLVMAGWGLSLSPRGKDWERVALYAGVLLSWAGFVVQGKGFPYHRYPLLAFLLVLMLVDFAEEMRTQVLVLRWMGAAGVVFAGLVLAPVSAYKVAHFDWRNDDYYAMLHRDLMELDGGHLSGRVQCLDTCAGCNDALYRMGLVQSTGFTADLYLWGPELPPGSAAPPVIAEMRARFLKLVEERPPAVLVVTRQDFLSERQSGGVHSDSNDKMDRWPEFRAYVAAHYRLVAERALTRGVRWSDHEEFPPGYQIYLRNGE